MGAGVTGGGGTVLVTGVSGFVAGGGPFELSGLLDDGGGGLVDGRGTSGRGIAEGICGVNGWGVSRMPL